MDTSKKHVYAAIVAVTEALGKEGITKDRKNETQGYKFRGIDDVYNALSKALSDAKLCILPRVTDRAVVERATRNGGALFYTTVRVEFDFVSAVDGSTHTITTYGEAMDSADKSTNKAMSAAYKYAAMQAFCIPTEGENDADAKTPDVAAAVPVPAKKAEPPKQPQKPPTAEMSALVALGHEMVLAGVAMAGSAAEKKKERMRWCGEVLGKEVRTSEDLTDGDIHRCIQAARKQAEARGVS